MSAQSQQQPSDPQPDPQPDPIWNGPWADDARRLFKVIQTALDEGVTESGGSQHPAECTFCPLCRGIAVLRRDGPDVLDRVSELAAGLAATLRSLDQAKPKPRADSSTGPVAGAATGSPAGPGSTRGPAQPPPSTVRIEVTD